MHHKKFRTWNFTNPLRDFTKFALLWICGQIWTNYALRSKGQRKIITTGPKWCKTSRYTHRWLVVEFYLVLDSQCSFLCLCHQWTMLEAYCIRVCPSVSEWVCACRKPREHDTSETNDGNFTQCWSQMYFGWQMCWLAFGFKGQGQGHHRQWPEKLGEYSILVNIWANFSKIRSCVYLDLRRTDYIKGKRSGSRQADDTISPLPMKAILSNFDMLIRFRGKKSKVSVIVTNDPKNRVNKYIFVNVWAVFTKIRWCM